MPSASPVDFNAVNIIIQRWQGVRHHIFWYDIVKLVANVRSVSAENMVVARQKKPILHDLYHTRGRIRIACQEKLRPVKYFLAAVVKLNVTGPASGRIEHDLVDHNILHIRLFCYSKKNTVREHERISTTILHAIPDGQRIDRGRQ